VYFIGFETDVCFILKVPKKLGRTYLVVLSLRVFLHGFYDGFISGWHYACSMSGLRLQVKVDVRNELN